MDCVCRYALGVSRRSTRSLITDLRRLGRVNHIVPCQLNTFSWRQTCSRAGPSYVVSEMPRDHQSRSPHNRRRAGPWGKYVVRFVILGRVTILDRTPLHTRLLHLCSDSMNDTCVVGSQVYPLPVVLCQNPDTHQQNPSTLC